MKRARLSTRDRLRIFEAHHGKCHLCSLKIQIGQKWDVSHPIALELGGADDDSNRAPAHTECHRAHTAMNDIPRIAKSRNVRARHVGAHVSRHPMPCGRRSKFKKKISGEVVLR